MGGQKVGLGPEKKPFAGKKDRFKLKKNWHWGKKQRPNLTGLEDNFFNFLFGKAKRPSFDDIQCFIHKKTAAGSFIRCVRHHNPA